MSATNLTAEDIRFVIVGLGNVGSQYVGSRHNIGFEVVDTLALRQNLQFSPGKGDFFQARALIRRPPGSGISGWLKRLLGGQTQDNIESPGFTPGFPGVLLKPTTLMNRSGIAVRQALELFSLEPQQVVVVVDDFHLPLGRLRLRKNGSDGGHRGLKSVITALGTADFPRLRVGIGPKPANREIKEFVLGQFAETRAPLKRSAVNRAAEACEELLFSSSENPLDIVAAKYNTVSSDPAPGSHND